MARTLANGKICCLEIPTADVARTDAWRVVERTRDFLDPREDPRRAHP